MRFTPKPEKGAYNLTRKARRATTKTALRTNMDAAKVRDRYRCRWAHETPAEARDCARLRVEACHTTHRGAGGDPQLQRSARNLIITFSLRCHARYDGRTSTPGLDDRRVVFLTPKKADGICAFEVKRRGRWVEVGREDRIGHLERGPAA